MFTSPLGSGQVPRSVRAVVGLVAVEGDDAFTRAFTLVLQLLRICPSRLALADAVAQVLAGRAAAGGAEREGQAEGRARGEAGVS